MMRRTSLLSPMPIAGSLLAILAVIAIATSDTGCTESYEAPCRVTARTVLVSDPTIGGRPSVELSRTRGRAAALWLQSTRASEDAGLDADADAADAGPPSIFIGFEMAIVDERGALASRFTIPAPPSLLARKGGVPDAGITVEDGASLVHWLETTNTTDPDGRVRAAATIRATYAGAPDTPTPASGSCEHCNVLTAWVAQPTESIVFFRTDLDLLDGPASVVEQPPSKFVALRYRRDGSAVEIPIPWLVIPEEPRPEAGLRALRSPTDRSLSARVDGEGRIVVTADGYVWLADPASLNLLAGPLVLPRADDARVVWSAPSPDEATIAWSIEPESLGVPIDFAPREVYTGLVPKGFAGVATRDRTSRGRAVIAVDRPANANDIGVLFESANRLLFAKVDNAGRKHGSDIFLGRTGGRSPIPIEYGTPTIAEAHELFARGNGVFHDVALGSGELVTTEVVCDAR